jgi:hypothetical protein
LLATGNDDESKKYCISNRTATCAIQLTAHILRGIQKEYVPGCLLPCDFHEYDTKNIEIDLMPEVMPNISG